MPSSTIWSDNWNESDSKLGIRGVEWKNLMRECLMATRINRNEGFRGRRLNPNVVMNIRHQMAKEYLKESLMPRCQMQSEAMKLIREDNKRKLLKIKEEKLVKKEIGKLKQILEFHGMLTKKYLEIDEKRKHEQPLPKIIPKVIKLWKIKVNTQYRVDKNKQAETSEKAIGKTKKMEPKCMKRGNLLNEKDEVRSRTHDGKRNDLLERAEIEEREVTKVEVKPSLPLLDVLNQRRMERAWQAWKIYAEKQRRREIEKKMYCDKIEAFLGKLQQSGGDLKGKLRVRTCEQEPKTFKLPRRAKTATNDEERQEKLRKLMREVRMSQTEVIERLRSRNESAKKVFPNPKFLRQMEERHEERLKSRKEIQARKQKLREENENAQKRKEEEKKRTMEQEKQKKLEELKEKRRAEKERKEAQRKKRDKIRRNNGLAIAHHRKVLLRSYGLRPWENLMKLAKVQYEQAVEFHKMRLLLMLDKWRMTIREKVEAKTKRAEQLYDRNLLKRYWSSWMEFRLERMSHKQAAVDWNEFKITETTFKRWMWFTEKSLSENLTKQHIAESHHKRKLKIKYLKKLRGYPEYKKEEREIEIRKLKWREKVKEILPDYQPVEIARDW